MPNLSIQIMIKIGITGQSGFVGTHLYSSLVKFPHKYRIIPFEDNFFFDEKKLCKFVKECDVIVHLAAMMRSPIEGEVYNTNMNLVNQLISTCNKEKVAPSILFASSIQEENGTEYGRCKQDGRKILSNWAEENKTGFGGMIFPNLFGPLARPNSHSFIATFCYKLTHNDSPYVLVDNTIQLKYIKSLIFEMIPFIDYISENKFIVTKKFDSDYSLKVSEVLLILKKFSDFYLKDGKIPEFQTQVEKDLYETLVEYKNYIL